jgi:hypothetical protein
MAHPVLRKHMGCAAPRAPRDVVEWQTGTAGCSAHAQILNHSSKRRGLTEALWTIRTTIIRAPRTVAAEAGLRHHALLIVIEIAREMAALHTDEAPRIAVRRLGRRWHYIRCQRQSSESNSKDNRLRHPHFSCEALLNTLKQRANEAIYISKVGPINLNVTDVTYNCSKSAHKSFVGNYNERYRGKQY